MDFNPRFKFIDRPVPELRPPAKAGQRQPTREGGVKCWVSDKKRRGAAVAPPVQSINKMAVAIKQFSWLCVIFYDPLIACGSGAAA